MDTQQRFEKLLEYSGLNAAQFAVRIGTKTKQAVYELQKGRTHSFSRTMMSKITKAFPEINSVWLLTGEGEMLRQPSPASSHADAPALEGKPIFVTAGEEPADARIIPVLPVAAQAGTLSEFSQAVAQGMICERIVTPLRDGDFAIRIVGDSMEPEYQAGTLAIVKKINEKAFIDWGKTFVLDTVNGIVIKRLFPAEQGADFVRCVSNNPAYPPFEIEGQYIIGFYRVLATFCLK